jgi:hypothetical protein
VVGHGDVVTNFSSTMKGSIYLLDFQIFTSLCAMEGFVQGDVLPEVFRQHVLATLDSHACAMLSRVSRGARHAVVGSEATIQLLVTECVKSLELVSWGRSNGMSMDWRVCAAAAQAGRVDVLEWARNDAGCGLPWDVLCAFAAGGGHLETLRWCRFECEPRCPWDQETTAAAAEKGHLKVIQWAVQHGCPLDDMTIEMAKRNGHNHVVQWAERMIDWY